MNVGIIVLGALVAIIFLIAGFSPSPESRAAFLKASELLIPVVVGGFAGYWGGKATADARVKKLKVDNQLK